MLEEYLKYYMTRHDYFLPQPSLNNPIYIQYFPVVLHMYKTQLHNPREEQRLRVFQKKCSREYSRPNGN